MTPPPIDSEDRPMRFCSTCLQLSKSTKFLFPLDHVTYWYRRLCTGSDYFQNEFILIVYETLLGNFTVISQATNDMSSRSPSKFLHGVNLRFTSLPNPFLKTATIWWDIFPKKIFMKKYEENMRRNMEEYEGNMKTYARNMKKCEELRREWMCRKLEKQKGRGTSKMSELFLIHTYNI